MRIFLFFQTPVRGKLARMIRFLSRSLLFQVTLGFAAAYVGGLVFIAHHFLPDFVYTDAAGRVLHGFRHPAFVQQAFLSFWPLDLLVYAVARLVRFIAAGRDSSPSP